MLMFILTGAEVSTLTLENIFLLIIAIATVIGSITVILNGITNIKLKNKQFIATVVDEYIVACNRETDGKIKSAIVNSQINTNAKIDSLSGKFEEFIRSDKAYKSEKDQEFKDIIQLLKNANIEVYKNDIRKVYYKLRETGEITDYDKEYVDSVFPIYKALGGNSDTEAKYNEICQFHQKLLRENFEKARAQKKSRKSKDLADAEENAAKEKDIN
jgi:hypothetical protein